MIRALRRTIAAGVLVALWAAPAVASGPSLRAGVAAGGGWDSNLSGASGAMPVAAGGYATASASLGGAIEPSSKDELSLELWYDGTRYQLERYRNLDVQRPSVELAWLREIGESLTLRIGPSAGWIVAGDSRRSGWDVGGVAAARLRLGDRTALRIAAAYRHRAANEQAFASDSLRARGGVERDLWRRATIAATYTLDVGQDTFYRPVASSGTAIAGMSGAGGMWGSGGGGSGPMGPMPDSTFGTNYEAYAADRTAHTAGLRLTQRFPKGVALDASYAYEIVLSDEADYRAHLVTIELSWRR